MLACAVTAGIFTIFLFKSRYRFIRIILHKAMRREVSGEMPEDLAEGLAVEKQQEQQLMDKLAAQGKLPARPASSFLQKKLQQRKFFDSGDYAMDKDRSKQAAPAGHLPHPMATTAATATASPAVKSAAAAIPEPVSPDGETNLQIPRPDTVPQRKASIINPSVHCKLSPLPHVQHHDVQPSQLPSVE